MGRFVGKKDEFATRLWLDVAWTAALRLALILRMKNGERRLVCLVCSVARQRGSRSVYRNHPIAQTGDAASRVSTRAFPCNSRGPQAAIRAWFSAIKNFMSQCAHFTWAKRIMVPGQWCTPCSWQCGHLMRCLSRSRWIRSASIKLKIFTRQSGVGTLRNRRRCGVEHSHYSVSLRQSSTCFTIIA